MTTWLTKAGQPVPMLGQGTWFMGEDPARRRQEADALRLGIDLGMTLIDTAEMYGEGGAEQVVGEAIAGRRDEVFVVSKVYPHNASREGVRAACERSLRRLGTDTLDLYLLHWRGAVPLQETIEGFEALKRDGKIRHYGVSNFDLDDMQEAEGIAGDGVIAANQVLFNLVRRGVEWDLLPWCRQHEVTLMAYSPLESASPSEQARLLGNPALKAVAQRHGATPAQVALAWLLRQDVCVIPKAVKPAHLRENRAALDLVLAQQDLEELDKAFPPPRRKVPLAMR